MVMVFGFVDVYDLNKQWTEVSNNLDVNMWIDQIIEFFFFLKIDKLLAIRNLTSNT